MAIAHKLQDWQRTLRLLIRHSQYYRPWKPDGNHPIISQRLYELFVHTNFFLKQLNVKYWLDAGTLLGYYRDSEIIKGDKDIDFGVHEKDYSRIWQARELLPAGFTLYDTSYRHYGPKLYITYEGWEADLYFYKYEGNRLHPYVKEAFCYCQPFPTDYIYPLQEAQFLGESTAVPHQVEVYLKHIYGYIGYPAVQDKKTGYWYQKSV